MWYVTGNRGPDLPQTEHGQLATEGKGTSDAAGAARRVQADWI